MKKTVTTILSLALALILVSSLSSGVILAKGDDGHDNRKKNKNKYETVRDVVVFPCAIVGFTEPITLDVVAAVSVFSGSTVVPIDPSIVPEVDDPCAEAIGVLIKYNFKIEASGPFSIGFNYTMVRKRKVLRENGKD